VADNKNGKIVQQLLLNRADLRRINPVSSGHTAIVYLNKRGAYVVGAGRLTMGEIWWNTPKEIYAVDVAPHSDSFVVGLPSAEEAFSFAATVRVTWRVCDPVAAVRGKLDDPNVAVRQYVEERLREQTRSFDVENSAAAERHINLQYGDRTVPVSDAVEITRCSVVLTLDESTSEHIRNRTMVVREREKLRHDKETEAHAHEVKLQQTMNEQELQRLTEKHDLALKKQRMEFYADAISTGSHNVLALRLAGHGEDVNDVIQLLMKQQSLEFEGARVVLNSLLEANLINRKDVAGIMANASNRMVEHLGGTNPLAIDGPKQRPATVPPTDDEDDE
jgi:hypothetical protein